MKLLGRFLPGTLVLSALAVGVWALVFHADWFKGKDSDDDEAGGDVIPIPTVRLGKVTKATLHRYVEGTGTVEPEPARASSAAAASKVASPVAGIVSEVHCGVGVRVGKGAPLFQLDDRIAKAEEEKAQAALGSTRASLAKLKSFPRPDQIRVAEMQVERSTQALAFSKKKQFRITQLVADQLASEKSLQESDLEVAAAGNDLATSEKQLALLRNSPTPEEVAEAQGKVVEAEKALLGAQTQWSLLRIQSPLAGTVLRVRVNAGEAVDLTTVLAEVMDLDRLEVEGSVPAASLPLIKPGMEVDIRASGEASREKAPTAPIRGKVVLVGLDVDRKTDSGSVRISLPKGSPVVPGQFVRLRIAVEAHKDHLVVPRECIVRTVEGKDVIVGFLGEKAVQKPVQVGIAEGDLIEVEGEDVNEDDAVVTQGAYGLPGEAKVRVEGSK
jgi:multidrug efflux pump subunit AcrA (membrane-fusion protein)